MLIQNSFRKIIAISSLLLLLFVSGCVTSHPLRISDQDWLHMSSSERLRAHEKQADLDRVRLALRAEEKSAEVALLQRKQEQLSKLKQNARYGDLVECILEPLEVRYSRKRKASRPVAFSLVRGEIKRLNFEDQKGRYRTKGWAEFHADGQIISICQHQSPSGLRECVDLLGTTKELHRGIKKKISVDKFLRGTLRCDLRPLNRRRYH